MPLPVVTSGLILHVDASDAASYPGSGVTWFDLSGSGNHVTLVNGPQWYNYGHKFFVFGNFKWGTFPTAGLPYGASPRTMSAWFTRFSSLGIPFSYGSPFNGAAAGLGAANRASVNAFGFNADASASAADTGRFLENVCFTYDGSAIKLYFNGVLVNTTPQAWNTVQDLAFIGRWVDPANPFWMPTAISQASLYNVMLTDGQVAANYAAVRDQLAAHSFDTVSTPVFEHRFSQNNFEEIGIGAAPLPQNTPPSIANFVPEAGTQIIANGPIQFEVTDAEGLSRIVVLASFADGTYDVVHDGDVFSPKYAASTKTPVSGGFLYVLAPTIRWIGNPTIRIIATDVAGSEAT